MLVPIARAAAIIGVIAAGILIVVAHRRRPEFVASDVALSVYFTYPTRGLMTSAYAAIAVALCSTAAALTTTAYGANLITAAACCIAAVLLIPVVATTQRSTVTIRREATRRAHRYAAFSAFLTIGIAMVASTYNAINEFDAPLAVLGFLGITLVVSVLKGKSAPLHGLKQRLLLAILGLWVVTIALTG